MKNEKLKKIYDFLERTFNDQITIEDYILHTFLLWSNIFLALVALLEIFFHNQKIFFHYIHMIEIFFGVIFLTEFILRLYFTYLKKSVHLKWSLVLQLIIIISLIAPDSFGNLAILRIVKSTKIIKIFILKTEQKKLSWSWKQYKILRKLHKANKQLTKKIYIYQKIAQKFWKK